MSVLIKGIDLPKEGNWITIRIEPDGSCDKPNWQGDCTLLKGVQAIEIPPHGDLIDRDEQIERAWRLNLSTRELIDTMLKSAPTIIPAEE